MTSMPGMALKFTLSDAVARHAPVVPREGGLP